MRVAPQMHLYLEQEKDVEKCDRRVRSLEKTIYLTGLEVDVDVEVSRGRGKTRNGLDISSKGIP